LPIGYHDGIDRRAQGFSISNLGQIVGTVNMCQITVLLNTDIVITKGTAVTVLTPVDFYRLALHNKQSVYELISKISARISKIIS